MFLFGWREHGESNGAKRWQGSISERAARQLGDMNTRVCCAKLSQHAALSPPCHAVRPEVGPYLTRGTVATLPRKP